MGFFPVTAIVGPRQCGKTTLAKVFMEGVRSALYLDLERPSDLARLAEPETYLGAQRGRVVCLDEIQRAPDLFQVLRTLVDETGAPGQFLVLGSASPELLRQSSETLAGRIGYLELTPFSEKEVGAEHQSELWIRGGFPRSFFAPSDHLSRAWRDNFIQTYLERDLPQLGVHIPAPTLRHFWEMCAHLQGELWNHAKVASALGVTGKTAAHYLTVLEQSYMLRRLPPTATNGKKRLVKSPRVYLRDSGLLHRILRIDTMDALCGHPVRGASWEGYVIEQIAAAVPDADLSFYRTSGGAEIDLLVRHANRLTAIEIKASSAPHVERGFWSALEDLQPDDAWIAAQIVEPFPLRQNVTVASVEAICQSLATSSDGFRKHSMSDA
ncbi:MAG: ATP-binding protein [Lentisphaerae bacterium]|nr:ATP-binding protein [Lentisphaerota bacterium]